jgi:hypothetical protein
MIVVKNHIAVTVICLLLRSLSTTATKQKYRNPPEAPIWPDQWHADFSTEWWGNILYKRSTNKGSYHYDWTNGKSLEEHGDGQKDNWCGCASKENSECKIIAFNEDPLSTSTNEKHDREEQVVGATYVVMPSLDICCKLFKGTGVLIPGWMKASEFDGYETAGEPERQCQAWLNPKPGNALLMKGDLWLMDGNGVPCGYRDVFKWWAKRLLGLGHYFTFDESTYSTGSESSDIFALPESLNCNTVCPNREDSSKRWCQSSWKPNAALSASNNYEEL